MNLLIHALPLASAAATGALFSAIWEGTVLAAVVVLWLRLLPGLSAAARSAIWFNVFVLLALLDVLPVLTGHSAGANPMHSPLLNLDLSWSVAIAGAWAMLSLWRAVQLILSAIQLHRLASRATPIHPDGAQRALLQRRKRDWLRGRSAELCTSAEVERPSVFGFFRPRILIPPYLAQRLTAMEVEQVVLHEMEHLRRRDDWSNLLQKVCLVLFPLNPALLWVERRLCAERELACDDRVLQSSAGRKAYAVCLTHLAEYSMIHRGLSLVLGAWERQSELVGRVHRILRRPAKSMSGRRAAVASAGLILSALVCAIVLAKSPQFVSFTPRDQFALQARADVRDVRPMNVAEFGGAPRMVKAIMPQRPLQSRPPQKQNCAFKRKARPHPVPSQQAWVVLTEWRSSEAPPQLVIAVARETRSTYAAVQFANGWLIVQI